MDLTFVLDASAVLRYIDDEPGADRVEQILAGGRSGLLKIQMSAVQWGEVIGTLLRRGESETAIEELKALTIEVVSVDYECAERSAAFRLRYKIPYVDSYAIELTDRSPNSTLITGDFDFKPAEADFRIEFLPTKARP